MQSFFIAELVIYGDKTFKYHTDTIIRVIRIQFDTFICKMTYTLFIRIKSCIRECLILCFRKSGYIDFFFTVLLLSQVSCMFKEE